MLQINRVDSGIVIKDLSSGLLDKLQKIREINKFIVYMLKSTEIIIHACEAITVYRWYFNIVT